MRGLDNEGVIYYSFITRPCQFERVTYIKSYYIYEHVTYITVYIEYGKSDLNAAYPQEIAMK